MNLRNLLLAIVTIAVLAGGYVVFQPAYEPKASVASGRKVFALTVDKSAADSADVPLFRAEEGDTVKFEISSTTEGVLSLHGYQKDARLSTREAVDLEFAAVHSGRFPMHVHAEDGAHLEVGVLQIEPRASGAR